MSTPTSMKLSDIFKNSNPKTAFQTAFQPLIQGFTNPTGLPAASTTAPIAPAVPTTNVTRTLPNGAGTYQSPVVAQTTKPVVPTQPVQPPAPTQPTIPPDRIDPSTGQMYTPEAYANMIAMKASGGSVPNYAGNAFTQGSQTSSQLKSTATDLNNQRNDIATGTTDPYKVGSKSGIAYSPTDLAAIEKAYAGIYDPALKDVFNKLDAKEKEDASARDLKNQLSLQAQKHKDDMALKSTNNNQMTDNERAAQTLFQGNPIVKDYNTVVNQKNTIDRIISNGVGGPADVSAIFTFMKALDPNSVVRESEYDKAAASGNLFQGIWTRFNGYFKDKGGILPENIKQEFQNLINQKLIAQGATYTNLADRTKEIAKRQGMNPDNVVIDFSGGIIPSQGIIVPAPDGTMVEITD